MDDDQPRIFRLEPSEDVRRAVGRPVLDDDHFEVVLRIVLREVRADGPLDGLLLVPRRNDDGDAGAGTALAKARPAGPEPANRQEVDRKEDETDPREDRGRDERAVNERYDSGTFWRASARYGEFG